MMTPRDLALIIFCCLIWAGTFIAGKVGVESFPPIMFAALRYILLAAILFPFLRWHRQQMRMIVGIALSSGALHIALFYIGMMLSDNIAVIAIAVQMEVPFAMLLSIVFLREQIGWRRMTGFFLCVVGMAVIGFDPAIFDYQDGIIFVLLSAFVGAVGTILMRRLKDIPVFHLQAWVAVVSAPCLIAMTALLENNHWRVLQTASLGAWGGVFYTALGASLLAYGLFYYLLQRYEVSLLATMTSLVPVFGVILAVVVRGDLLTTEMIIGGLTILIGTVVIVERNKGKVRRSMLVG